MSQDRHAFPLIAKVIETAVIDNGGLNRFRPIEDIHAKIDEVLGQDGVDYADLQLIEDWLKTLNEEEFDLACSGEETEMQELYARAPAIHGQGDGATVADFFEGAYEHCI